MDQQICGEALSTSCQQRGRKKCSTRTVRARAWQRREAGMYQFRACSAAVVLGITALIWMDVVLWDSSVVDLGYREMYSSDSVLIQENDHNDINFSYQHHHGKLRHKLDYDRFSIHQQTKTLVDTYGFEIVPTAADAIVVGSGLAGLTAALMILDRGGKVIIFEKEPMLGGNSNKASSGINACCLAAEQHNNDTLSLFRNDTVRSAGNVANLNLIDTLVGESANAVTWLRDRIGVDLSVLALLGGHSRKRTHRPQKGFVGAEIMASMQTAIRAYEPTGRISIYVNTQVTQLISDDEGTVLGVISESRDGHNGKVRSDHVILATGGFASDRSQGSYLEKFRPELVKLPTTAGAFSTGDGIAMAESIGASTRDMEKIQLHPTGFVDPDDPNNPNKVLAAELLRGAGGLLINSMGDRFCNELGTRDYVSGQMMNHKWQSLFSSEPGIAERQTSKFFLLLSQGAAEEAKHNVKVYMAKGLLREIHGLDALAHYMNVPKSALHTTLEAYRHAAKLGMDGYGKTVFENFPGTDLESEVFVLGQVTPVLHYCMGGLTIDPLGRVLKEDGTWIEGLHGAGEVTGGVHGNNRLGGNSLLECAVFGGIVGTNIPIDQSRKISAEARGTTTDSNLPSTVLSMEDVAKHNSRGDCWVSLYGIVYDLTEFVDQHPGGAKTVLALAGTDGTLFFDNVHSPNILERLKDRIVGILMQQSISAQIEEDRPRLGGVSITELQEHSSPENLWVVLHGTVYDLTQFSHFHPGGEYLIQELAGKDGTDQFQVFHDRDKLEMIQKYAVGEFMQDFVTIAARSSLT